MNHIILCCCNAYPVEHPMGVGTCKVEDIDKPVCTSCGQNCEPKAYDDGIGPYEYWGQKCFDSRPYIGSDCCEADMISPDTGLTYESEPLEIVGRFYRREHGTAARYVG